jgi:iron complex outermembrane receptor protein/hemoglobin/transferrin/lactoferrin receptor protein
VDLDWLAAVANAGLAWAPVDTLTLLLNYEQGFRPPNLDDLTGRQPTGRGYQLENSRLVPERAQTVEAGVQWHHPRVSLEVWAALSLIADSMERRAADCPEGDRECAAARAAVELVNLTGTSEVRSLEARARAHLGYGVSALATFAWTVGEGDNPNEGVGGRVPLSRIPPINGVGELRWESPTTGLYVEGAVRWALDQTDLSVGDVDDARIPFGGTPGAVVFDARAGLVRPMFAAYLVVENLADTPNRTHGSAINGPGRGLILNLEIKP